jgi:hypothetical protein
VSAAEGFAAARDDEMRRRADLLEEWHERDYGVVDLDEERDERRETECPVCFGWSVGPCLRSACEPDGSNMPGGFWAGDDL